MPKIHFFVILPKSSFNSNHITAWHNECVKHVLNRIKQQHWRIHIRTHSQPNWTPSYCIFWGARSFFESFSPLRAAKQRIRNGTNPLSNRCPSIFFLRWSSNIHSELYKCRTTKSKIWFVIWICWSLRHEKSSRESFAICWFDKLGRGIRRLTTLPKTRRLSSTYWRATTTRMVSDCEMSFFEFRLFPFLVQF